MANAAKLSLRIFLSQTLIRILPVYLGLSARVTHIFTNCYLYVMIIHVEVYACFWPFSLFYLPDTDKDGSSVYMRYRLHLVGVSMSVLKLSLIKYRVIIGSYIRQQSNL